MLEVGDWPEHPWQFPRAVVHEVPDFPARRKCSMEFSSAASVSAGAVRLCRGFLHWGSAFLWGNRSSGERLWKLRMHRGSTTASADPV